MRRIILILIVLLFPTFGFAQKYLGGDISMLPAYEAAGSHYYDSNGQSISDVLTYLKDQGMNSMRVRLFVDPSKASAAHQGEGVRQDLDWVKTLGARIKAAGLHFLLDFHYSDTWTDPGKHSSPDAWKSMTADELKQQIYTYTKETLEALKRANAQPDAIQVGNELNVGQLWNTGKTTPWSQTSTEFSNFLNYTKQAAKACRETCPNAKVVFHVAMNFTSEGNANNNSYIRNWAQILKDQSFDYDILGISYYPYYHGPLTELETLLTFMNTNFPEKKVQLVEAGYPHKWYPSDATYNYTDTYPDTNEGQKKFTQDLITLLNGYDNVNGLYWWWPEANEYWRKAGADQVTTGWYNMGLWDNENGKATPALYELKNFLNGGGDISNPVATPTFSRDENNVSIACSTAGASIYYTLDGSTPTRNGTPYTGPIALTQNGTIKAIAVADGYVDSQVSTYTVDWFKVANVVISNEGKKILMTTPTSDAIIYYTLDDTTPTVNSIRYTGVFSVETNCTVKARAFKDGFTPSDVTSYDVNPGVFTCAMPTFVRNENTVSIACSTEGATIYYTLDGSEPTSTSTVYTAPIVMDKNGTLKAIATKTDYLNSNIATYTVDWFKVDNVAITFENNQVKMTTATTDATIYYTLDGSTPTKNSNVYTAPITLTQNCTVKAVAIKENFHDSEVASYIVNWFKVDKVQITFANLKVSLATSTANARIYYTINGSTPTENSTLYTEPFAVTASCTVKAVAFKDNYNPSDETNLFIDMDNVRCDVPTFQQTDKELTITTQTEGTTIYFTLDGTTPTTASNRYIGPITLTRNGTVKAYAVKPGYLDSNVASYEVTYFQVKAPSFSANGNVLTISCGTEGAAIYYKIGEGVLEIVEQNRYTGPVSLTDNRIVKAIGIMDGYRNSEEATYNPESFSCEDVTIAYNGRYVTLSSATDGSTIYYTTDGSNPSTASQLYTGSRVMLDGLCTVNAVAMKENMNNSNVVSTEISYLYDGETATIRQAGQLRKAFEWNQGTAMKERLVVKGQLNASDFDFIKTLSSVEFLDMKEVNVEGGSLSDNAFSNMNLVSIDIPAGISQVGNSLFEGCNQLAAIIWNANTRLTEEVLTGVSNPNLLIYVNTLSQTSRTTNVVSMGMNKAFVITLQDTEDGNGNFYCPREFKAEQISYTRNFQMESGKKSCAGWETIALPFNVATITHEINGSLAPFGSTVAGAKPFWLYSMENNGYNPAMEIVANTPYVICMPNHPDYADEYIQKGNVTFSASNVDVPVTSPKISKQTTPAVASLVPAFSTVTASNKVYAINKEYYGNYAPGSLFIQYLRDVRPFEAYLTTEDVASRTFIPIFEDNLPTGINDASRLMNREEMNNKNVYNLNGQRVEHPKKGVYIKNGRKVVIK